MNKTNIKRAKAFALAILTTMTLSACAQAPSNEESDYTSSKYNDYIFFNVGDNECRVLAKSTVGNLSFHTYRLEDGTKVTISNASGELLDYEADSREMAELMANIDTEILSSCEQTSRTEESNYTSSRYTDYILFNVGDRECRMLAEYATSNLSFHTYRLEDGTKIIISNASGELLAYEADSSEMAKLMAKMDTIILSSRAQTPSTEEGNRTTTRYTKYILFNVSGMECRMLADYVTSNLSFHTYRLEDGTKITISNASGELLEYEANSSEMAKLMAAIDRELDKSILTLD